jgi:hypothetical protein
MSAQCFYKLGVIGYYQLNQDYIAEVLCINKEKPLSTCHGQCFLKQKLNLAEEKEKAPAPLGKEKIEIIVFLVSQCHYLFKGVPERSILNSAYDQNYSSDHTRSTFHPPCFS